MAQAQGGDFINSLLSGSATSVSADVQQEFKSGYFVESGAIEG